jgi:hypothetical protein
MLPGLFYQINHAHATCIWHLAADATKCCVTTSLTTTVDPDKNNNTTLTWVTLHCLGQTVSSLNAPSVLVFVADDDRLE